MSTTVNKLPGWVLVNMKMTGLCWRNITNNYKTWYQTTQPQLPHYTITNQKFNQLTHFMLLQYYYCLPRLITQWIKQINRKLCDLVQSIGLYDGTKNSSLSICSSMLSFVLLPSIHVTHYRSIQVSEECLINDTKTFEAKEEGLRGGKIQLAVDPRRGTISFGKSGTEYFHQQVWFCTLMF